MFFKRKGVIKIKKLLTITLVLFLLGVFVSGKFDSSYPTDPESVYAAEVDYFLQIPGVGGEATKEGHADQIQIESWSWGETQQAALLVPAIQKVREAASRDTDQAVAQEIMFQMKMSKASPQLMQYSASGKRFDEDVILTGYKAGDAVPFLIIKMKPVYISSYQTSGSSGDVVPVDTISLNFGAVKFEYRPQDDDGTLGEPVEGSWDFQSYSEVKDENGNNR